VKLSADIPALVLAVAIIAVVVGRAATSPLPPPLKVATPQERAGFAAVVARDEPDWRMKASNDFPADHWSQRDAFHGHEALTVRDLARGAGVSYEDVFRAIDDDIHHSRTNDRNAQVVPVKPRPIFD
jgi:hypothetical protein